MDAYSLIHKKPWSDGLHNIFDQADINIFENKCRWCLDGDGGGGDGGDGGDGDSFGGFDSAASDEGIGGRKARAIRSAVLTAPRPTKASGRFVRQF
jgi:hypothetical protein